MIRPIDVNLAGRVAVVTGANTGIGKEIARDLARLNAKVILACRSASRGRKALDEIVADTGNHKTELAIVDLSSRASIAAFARDLAAKEKALHVLVNNAGVWMTKKKESVDGVEMTWATNVLGCFALTRELAPLLEAGAKSDPSRTARVITSPPRWPGRSISTTSNSRAAATTASPPIARASRRTGCSRAPSRAGSRRAA